MSDNQGYQTFDMTAEEVAEIKSQSKSGLNEQNIRDGYAG